jgi:hypothetical protein
MSPKKNENKKRKHEKKEKKKKEKRQRNENKVSTTTTSSSSSSITPSSSPAPSSSSSNKKAKLKQTNQKSTNGNSNSNSPFQEKRVRILVSLPPASLINIPNALNASMQNLLLKYSNSLGGVLVSFSDIKLDNSQNDENGSSNSNANSNSNTNANGRIINEMPHIHYYIKCTVLIFNPSIGTVLKGKVNESFPSHVGLIVHEVFNAMISAESLRQNGFVFDDDSNEWRKNTSGDDNGNNGERVVTIDDGMQFTVDKLHECHGLISLECKDPTFLAAPIQ